MSLDEFDENHQLLDINDAMRQQYLDYAMSVIVSRALPDARDGLKPVHRRILWAMKEGGYDSTKPYKKSARAVGDVMGKYHPHGDSAIYDAMVRMAQRFSMRMLLIDGQGNFGSMDGDPAAAMRYTEARLSKNAEDLLEDIDRDTVDFVPNYDGSMQQPSVVPAALPNLLINGAEGIAVGMATKMAPHSPYETLGAAIAYAKNRDISLDELMEILPGPDFPTGGIICGTHGIREAYMTGRGQIILRGKAEIETRKLKGKGERECIVVTEVPYQVNKAKLEEKIAELAEPSKDSKGNTLPPVIPGIADVRDESDRDGVSLVVEVARDGDANAVLAALYKETNLQINFNVNALALNKGRPEIMGLKDLLRCFIDHREEVIARRSEFLLTKAREKLHIVLGLLMAVDNADLVIDLIRKSPSPSVAKERLMTERFSYSAALQGMVDRDLVISIDADGKIALTEEQAKAILDLRLHRLTGLERDKITGEGSELCGEIDKHLGILNNHDLLVAEMIGELEEAREKRVKDTRRTQITNEYREYGDLDLVPLEDIVVTMTADTYCKRTPLAAFRAQGRGGQGKIGAAMKEGDEITMSLQVTTHDKLLVISENGVAYTLPVAKIPAAAPNSRGKPIINLIEALPKGVGIAAIEPLRAVAGAESEAVEVPEGEEMDEAESAAPESKDAIVFVFGNGDVRRSPPSAFAKIKANGKRAFPSEDADGKRIRLVSVQTGTTTDDIVLFTKDGIQARFPIGDLREVKSTGSTGVRGIRLKYRDEVVGSAVVPSVEMTTDERDAYLAVRNGNEPKTVLEPERLAYLAGKDVTLLTVTENGIGKRSSSHEYRATGRGVQGSAAAKIDNETGPLVAVLPVAEEDQIIMTSKNGQTIRLRVEDVNLQSRVTRGTRLMKVESGDSVVSVQRILGEQD